MLEHHQPDQEGADDPFHETTPIKKVWKWCDNVCDFLMWLHASLIIYILMMWLVPMIVAYLLMFVVDLRPMLKGKFDWWTKVSLTGIPVWLIVSGYAYWSDSELAHRIRSWSGKFVLGFGIVLLLTGLLGWLLNR